MHVIDVPARAANSSADVRARNQLAACGTAWMSPALSGYGCCLAWTGCRLRATGVGTREQGTESVWWLLLAPHFRLFLA